LNKVGMSRLAMSHFHINIAESIGEADRIKPLNRNRKTLEKEKCRSWVISDLLYYFIIFMWGPQWRPMLAR